MMHTTTPASRLSHALTCHGAHGVATVCSAAGPECHAASGYDRADLRGSEPVSASGRRDLSQREKKTREILAFWQSQGVARSTCPRNLSCPRYAATGACADTLDSRGQASNWHARDLTGDAGMWLPRERVSEGMGRADRFEVSHIVHAGDGGAFCGCGTFPESAASNLAAGEVTRDLPASILALVAAWPAWTMASGRAARAASRKRLA